MEQKKGSTEMNNEYILRSIRATYRELAIGLKRKARWITRIVGSLVILFFVVHLRFPEALPHILTLNLPQMVVINLLLLLIERVLVVERAVDAEIERRRQDWIHRQRKDAYAHLQGLLRERGPTIERLDLLQFSGVTALPVIEEAARVCRGANVRMLIVKPEIADHYDEAGFHRTRIQHTLQALKVLFEEYPQLTVDVWYYSTPPAISGILVDNVLVSAGWYHVFPPTEFPDRLSIRGHITPAITAADVSAEPLLSMVRAQFESVLRAAEPALHLPLSGGGDSTGGQERSVA
jgi:hypothetical protein